MAKTFWFFGFPTQKMLQYHWVLSKPHDLFLLSSTSKHHCESVPHFSMTTKGVLYIRFSSLYLNYYGNQSNIHIFAIETTMPCSIIDKVNNIAWHILIDTKNRQMAFQSVGGAVVAFCSGPHGQTKVSGDRQRETTMKFVVQQPNKQSRKLYNCKIFTFPQFRTQEQL